VISLTVHKNIAYAMQIQKPFQILNNIRDTIFTFFAISPNMIRHAKAEIFPRGSLSANMDRQK